MQPLTISKNKLELVMGLFEKVTHKKTEYLHHVSNCSLLVQPWCLTDGWGFGQGMEFPPFSDYQETFSAPPAPVNFTTFIPIWVPTPFQVTCIARVIYPHWHKQCTEQGHQIIPTLNVSYLWTCLVQLIKFFLQFDKTDMWNGSHICFWCHEIKAVCKMCASQLLLTSSSACSPNSSCH